MKDNIEFIIKKVFDINLIYSLGEVCIIISLFTFTMLALNATFTISFCIILIIMGLSCYIIAFVCELHKKQNKEKAAATEIEAFKYDGNAINLKEVYTPEWVKEAYKKGILFYDSLQDNEYPQELFIKISNGIYHVNPGDYIIRDINGEIHIYELDDPVKLR